MNPGKVSKRVVLDRICTHQLGDVERLKEAYLRWLRKNPEKLDETL